MKSHSASHWDAAKKQITTGFLEISLCSLQGLLNCCRPTGFLIGMWTKPPFLLYASCYAAPGGLEPTPCHLASFYQPPAGKSHGCMDMGDHQAGPGSHSLTFSSLPSSLHPVTSTSFSAETSTRFPPTHAACLLGMLLWPISWWQHQDPTMIWEIENLNNGKNECTSRKEIFSYFS